jgi:hypothetical protein
VSAVAAPSAVIAPNVRVIAIDISLRFGVTVVAQ